MASGYASPTPLLRRWLETDTGAEMVRFKDLLDADSNSSNGAPA